MALFDPADLARYPQEPGVYLMKDASEGVLYVGKAKSLRQRLRQYFSGHDTRAMIPFLLSKVVTIEPIVVSSEKEALLLEHHLIQKHRPPYNALLKDDAAFCFLRLSTDPWPRLELVRLQGTAPDRAHYFGPYPSSGAARRTLELLQELFPMRRCSDQELVRRTRPCILHEMKRCIAPCVELCTKEEYHALVEEVLRFLRGQDRSILKRIREQREQAAEALEFEEAQRLHDLLSNLEMVFEEQHVHTARDEPTDVWGLYREGDRVAVSLLLFRQGRLAGARHLLFDSVLESDSDLLTSLILQQANQESPSTILTAAPLEDAEALLEILAGQGSIRPKLLHPQRGAKAAVLDMANRNAAATFRRADEGEDKRMRTLLDLQQLCHLNQFPEKIETYDTSHLAGSDPVSASVTYEQGLRTPAQYRKYILKQSAPGDDYGALREVLDRRCKRLVESQELPHLILIDGGAQHLAVAKSVLEAHQLLAVVDLIAVSKEEGRHDKGISQEQLHLTTSTTPLLLPLHSPVLLLIQQMRDEAHRVAISFQRSRRRKSHFDSDLLKIPGIGPQKTVKLLKHFGSLKRILESTPEEWAQCPGITRRDVTSLETWAQEYRQ